MGRMFDKNACSAMPVSLLYPSRCSTPTPAGTAVLIPSPACHIKAELMARDLTLRWPEADRLQGAERAEPAG